MIRDDDFDIDDLLEAPYKSSSTSKPADDKDKTVSTKKGGTRDKSASPSKRKEHQSKSDRSRSRDRDRKRRRDRSNSKERRKRRSRSRSSSRDRNRRKSPDRRSRRRSRSRSPTRNKEVVHRSADGVTTISLRSDREREQENLTQEERDARTVFIMQLARNVTITDIQDFFNKVGHVRDVRFISDRNSRRSKGIGYVEFLDPSSVTLAIKLSGQRLLGVPIMVSPTMAEKNRTFAAQQAALVKREGPMKLYVGSLHYNITESMLQAIFEPFGVIDSVQLQYDPE